MTTPLADLSWPRRTEMLSLRPATSDDVGAMWAYHRLDAVNRWLSRALPTEAAFRAHCRTPDRLAAILVVERHGQIIGDLMVDVGDAWGQDEIAGQARATQAELGWCFDPTQGGHGYATEAVREQIRICFEDLGLRRVVAYCFAANEPSWRLMERVGMRREAYYVRESLHRSGEWHDSLAYAMLADE